MPAVIPIVAAFASGAVGAVVAGTATLGAYLTVAGAALSTLGALSGKEDLAKFGAVLSLGGGLASGFGGASGAGSAAADAAATGGADAATSAAWSNGAGLGGDTLSAVGASEAGVVAGAGAGAFDPSAVAGSGVGDLAGNFATATAEEMAGLGADMAGGSGQQMLNDALTTSGGMAEAGQATFADPTNSLMSTQPMAGGYAQPGGLMDTMAAQQQPTTLMAQGGPQAPAQIGGAVKPAIQEGAQGLTSKTLGDYITSAGKWAEQNKSMLNFGGMLLQGMYGPQAQASRFQESLWNTRMKNLNSPIRLGPITKG